MVVAVFQPAHNNNNTPPPCCSIGFFLCFDIFEKRLLFIIDISLMMMMGPGRIVVLLCI